VKRSLCILAALTLIMAVGCRQSDDPAPKKSNPGAEATKVQTGGQAAVKAGQPALLLDAAGAAAVLLDGPEGIKEPPKRPKGGQEADNSRCHVCHVNFADERLAVAHTWFNIGCEKCHGPSDDHCGDEGNITPPSTMFAKADIDKSCKVCHPDDRFVEGAKSCPVVVLEEGKYCTDCHGRHQMECRTVRWDKKTGALLPKVVEKR